VTVPDDLARTYRVAFLRYLDHGQEAALHRGYELGRSAVTDGVSILDVAHLHHELLREVLEEDGDADVSHIATAASEFLLEVLATYDMAQRRMATGGG
jgi:Phosphoserine phosphatase RsbU, N-terminal domain